MAGERIGGCGICRDERGGEGGLRVGPRADGAPVCGVGRLAIVLLTVLLA